MSARTRSASFVTSIPERGTELRPLARHGREVIAAAVGFLGRDEAGLHLHSHIAGVVPAWQVKRGAQITRYYVDFHGEMQDEINGGDETDRCLVTWRLVSAEAEAAARGEFAPTDVDSCRRAGAADVLTIGPAGPVVAAAGTDVRLQQIPRDIVQLRRQNPALARSWRLALRQVLVAAFADGLEVVGVSRDSWYVVARSPSG